MSSPGRTRSVSGVGRLNNTEDTAILEESSLFSLRPATTELGFSLSNESHQAYQKIGFGQCGLVFTKPGSGHVVKVARPHFSDGLWNDLLSHSRLFKALSFHDTGCAIPRVYSYVNRNNTSWWHANASLPSHDNFPLPSEALVTQRIPPLPKTTRHVLIDRFCPEGLRTAAKESPLNIDCLARIYLGRRRTPGAPPTPNFSLRNFNFCLDQMLELGLQVEDYAREIATCLAIVHWQARMDGFDIEFVLGSDVELSYTTHVTQSLGMDVEQLEQLPKHSDIDVLQRQDFQKRVARLWVLDFNLCNRFPMDDAFIVEHEEEVLTQLVHAFFENDPYYPLPLMEMDGDRQLWSVFRQEYERKAAEVLGTSDALRHLPMKFMDACVEREQKKLDKGLGHGHRDFKA